MLYVFVAFVLFAPICGHADSSKKIKELKQEIEGCSAALKRLEETVDHQAHISGQVLELLQYFTAILQRHQEQIEDILDLLQEEESTYEEAII